MIRLEKSVESDKRQILQSAVSSTFKYQGDEYIYAYLIDYDAEYVYFETYYESRYYCWKAPYTFNNMVATIGDVVSEVVRTTEYVEVQYSEDETEKSIEKKLFKWLDKYFGGSSKENKLPVVKSLFEEQMIAIEPLYIAPGEVDGHQETIDEEGVQQLVKSVNDAIESGTLKANYFHSVWTDHFTFLKAWVNPYDCLIGETEVKKGLPIIEVQYLNKAAWEARKSGKLLGLSIEGTCEHEELE